MASTNRRFLPALLLLFLSSTELSLAFTSSNALGRPISSHHAGKSLLRLKTLPRGGDLQLPDEDQQRPWASPLQLSMMGIAPLKWITGSIVRIFSVYKGLTATQKLLFAATFLMGFLAGKVRPFWKRYTDVNDIPMSLFGGTSKALRGRAVKVSDGDTIRFLHQPTPWHPEKLEKGQKLSEFCLPVRLCTIDTPETAKFGKPGQPFGPEAKEHLQSLLENQVVYVRLLQKDQYSRAVAQVFTKKIPFLGPNRYMDEEMLQEGLAEVYTGGGAVYGPLGKDGYLAVEEEAQQSKKGIWSMKNRESAAEYKKRTKE